MADKGPERDFKQALEIHQTFEPLHKMAFNASNLKNWTSIYT